MKSHDISYIKYKITYDSISCDNNHIASCKNNQTKFNYL